MKYPLVLLILLANLFLSTQLQAQQNRSVDVTVQKVALMNVQTPIEAIGSLRANESIVLTAEANKKITRINFDDGQRVNKGQILVEMTSFEERALMDEARINAQEAKKQWERVDALAKQGAASQSLLDQRLREYEAAQARYNALESRLKDLLLQAPFSGIVGLREVSVGALVSPGKVITTLNDDSRMKLDFTVPSIFLSSIAIGQKVSVLSGDLPNLALQGEVASMDNQIDPVTRAIKVRALLSNADHQLKQGMLMMVKLHSHPRSALVISESALMPLASNHFVFVVKTENEKIFVERRKIEIGQRLVGAVEVLSGIQENEKVVTHGVHKLREGQLINIISEEDSELVKNHSNSNEIHESPSVGTSL